MQDTSSPLSPSATPSPLPVASELMRVVQQAALAYRDAGLSLVPISPGGQKAPAWNLLPRSPAAGFPGGKASWHPFQTRLPTHDEIRGWFGGWCTCIGIAVIGGRISDNLEVIDFDLADLFEPWRQIVEQQAPGLVDRLVHVQSPRPGRHVYYRCPATPGNKRLASRVVVDDQNGKPTLKTLIETKGEGGYVLVPPSPPNCHKSGRPYLYLGDRDLTQVPTITVQDRRILLDAACSFDEAPRQASRWA